MNDTPIHAPIHEPIPVPITLAVIVASTREGRIGPTVARWFLDQTGDRPDLQVDLIDLVDSPVPEALHAPGPESEARLARLTPRLGAADAFVVVTPEYNKSFPAPLKDLIDWHVDPWRAKPVGFVSYGGMSGGLRAVEQLRLIFSELHATTIRDTVSFHGIWTQFADGVPADHAGANAAAKVLIDELVWWAVALRDARHARPYAA